MKEALDYISNIGIKLLIISAIYLIFREPDQVEPPPPKKLDSNNIAFDWEHNRYITKQMADTMFFTGGHWYNKSNKPKSRTYQVVPHNPNSRGTQWIRPAGNEFIYRKDQATERMWRDYQKPAYEPITEDDIRDIIVTEFER